MQEQSRLNPAKFVSVQIAQRKRQNDLTISGESQNEMVEIEKVVDNLNKGKKDDETCEVKPVNGTKVSYMIRDAPDGFCE